MARPKGAKAKYPTHSKIRDELLRHDFDWMAEYTRLFRRAAIEIQKEMLLAMAPYLFPRRKPEDANGNAEVSPSVIVAAERDVGSVTVVDIDERVKQLRGED